MVSCLKLAPIGFFVEITDRPAQNGLNSRSRKDEDYPMALFWLDHVNIRTAKLDEINSRSRKDEDYPMALFWLDHVNIRTAKLDEMSAFYENILGLPRGKRPSFGMGGAWHYCGQQAVVHLVEAAKRPKTEEAQIEHFAFRSNGTVKAFQKKMRESDTPYKVSPIPEINMIQVNVFDPDGNKIEIQFAASEADMEEFGGSAAARRRMRKGDALNTTKAMPVARSKSKVTKTNKKLGVPKPIKPPKKRFVPT
jgi:catechol 2,3-dioxygenase-like lactoylglutathione lyase family enzyme